MAKQLPTQRAVCTNCFARFEGAPRYSFLGLMRFGCPRCQQSFLYPMSPRRRKWYFVIGVLFAALFIGLVVWTGTLALPGVLPVAATIALIQDSTARKKVAAAEAALPPAPA
jgi:hypothetical protein